MLRLLTDENFNGDVTRGLTLRRPELDLVRVPVILEWAAANVRILLTHDRATIPSHAFGRLAVDAVMAGVFILSPRVPVGAAIEEILFLDEATDNAEWRDRVVYLPL